MSSTSAESVVRHPMNVTLNFFYSPDIVSVVVDGAVVYEAPANPANLTEASRIYAEQMARMR